ncbi:MAG: 50S ribosomal protein L13 [Halobacteriales archaeon]|nr:50S ribosomal protein L13 [Halobacteriales archaeon]
MNLAEFDPDTVVDARGCILGRVASAVAERALDGESIAVVNAQDVIITGREDDVLGKYRKRTELGSDRGPQYPKRPDGILKRSIRGMVPYDTTRGREAFERVRVYVGNPYDDREPEVVEGTSMDRLSNIHFVELGDISAQLGANVTW